MFQCNSICWFIQHIITVFLFNHTVLYFIKKWFIVTNFTLPRLFRNPAISNFFPFPLGLRNSRVRLYCYFDVNFNTIVKLIWLYRCIEMFFDWPAFSNLHFSPLNNNIEDITRWRKNMNFIFEWQNNILRTSAASE